MTKPTKGFLAAVAAMEALDIDALLARDPDPAPLAAVIPHLDSMIGKAAAVVIAVGLKREALARSGRVARARALDSSDAEARSIYGKVVGLRNDIAARLIAVERRQSGAHRPTA
jgi:hypothetical protein